MSDIIDSFDSVYDRNEDNIKKICLMLCKKYLSKEWIKLSENDLIFHSVGGGFVNQTYFCSLPKSMASSDKEVTQVIIRFYGEFNSKTEEQKENLRFNDVINSLILSLKGLSPKIHGIFSCGQIQEYFKSRWFDIEEQKNPQIVLEVAKTLAKVHSIRAPISKISKPLYERLEEIYKKRLEKYPINELLARSECKELSDTDMKSELAWIKNVVLLADSPIVFSHKDFWGPNILIGECNTIKVCDLEWCSYGPRARDFASLFNLWGRKLMDFSDPMSHKLVSDSVMEFFFEKYREKLIEIYGENYENDENNSIGKLIFETKLYILVMRLFYFLILIHLDKKYNKPNIQTQIGSKNFNIVSYFQLKKQLIAEKIV